MSIHMYRGEGRVLQGFVPILKSSRAVAFCCGIPNISDQIKVAENTRDLFGLVGGGARVKRLRPQGQSPARSGLSEELALRHKCAHCPFPTGLKSHCPRILQGKTQQALRWRGVTLHGNMSFYCRMLPLTFHTNYWVF